MTHLISGANSIVATFGLYSGDMHETLTVRQLWDERSAEAESFDVFHDWVDKALKAGLIEEVGEHSCRLTPKGIQRMNFLNRMIEDHPEIGDVGYRL